MISYLCEQFLIPLIDNKMAYLRTWPIFDKIAASYKPLETENCIEQNPCKTQSCSNDYHNFRSLYSMNIQYCFQKNLLLLFILSHMNLVHTLIFISVSQVLGL
jgi:hypothetical protein